MFNKKAFTLIEITVVVIIVGILACIAIGTYLSTMNQQAAIAAEHNLISIYNAQKNYYFTTGNGTYCVPTTLNANLCTSLNTGSFPIDSASTLNLNITDNYFNYACVDPNGTADNGTTFNCTATNIATPSFILTVTNAPIVLPGGTGCATTSGGNCNPKCSPPASSTCPSS